jgi:flavin-dependent thymidylate synthase
MKVELISITPDALNLLLRTKNTRLKYEDNPANWSDAKKQEHLNYMLGTIKSSFEFIDCVFKIEGVTRAFTHELVRTRHGSYAQQSQRVIDASENEVKMPDGLTPLQQDLFTSSVRLAKATYGDLLKSNVPAGEARGVLPTNLTTAIICKFNLRTLHETAMTRLCTRAAREYQDVFRAMRTEVIKVLPWCDPFLQPQCVARGDCAFPRYGRESCPVWTKELDREEVKATMGARFWAAKRYSAAPVAIDGMSKG